jgi:hypothetical protein
VRKGLFAVMTACVALASLSGLAWAETASPQTFVVYAAGPASTPRTVTRTAQGCTSTPYFVATFFVYQGTVTLAQPAAA